MWNNNEGTLGVEKYAAHMTSHYCSEMTIYYILSPLHSTEDFASYFTEKRSEDGSHLPIIKSINLRFSTRPFLSSYSRRIPLTKTQSLYIIMRGSHHPLSFLKAFSSFVNISTAWIFVSFLLNHSQQHLDTAYYFLAYSKRPKFIFHLFVFPTIQ